MANLGGVSIDSGPIEATVSFLNLPKAKWRSLIEKRRDFVRRMLPHDCRCLVGFWGDANRMYEGAGFESANDLIENGLKLRPEEVRWAIAGLELMQPGEPIPYQDAIHAGLGARERGVMGGKAGPGRGRKTGDNITRFERGTGKAYTLARLDRDGHAELAAKVRRKELSANQAAIKAGFRKPPPEGFQALQIAIRRWLPSLTETERAALKAML